jgi:hypothetical protein
VCCPCSTLSCWYALSPYLWCTPRCVEATLLCSVPVPFITVPPSFPKARTNVHTSLVNDSYHPMVFSWSPRVFVPTGFLVCSHGLPRVFPPAFSCVDVGFLVCCVHAHPIATCQVLDADEVSSRVDEGHPPVHPNQLACADVVLLNKCDLVDPHHLDSAAAYLAGAIPGVEVSTPSAIAHTHPRSFRHGV